jgi:hypothetical protein
MSSSQPETSVPATTESTTSNSASTAGSKLKPTAQEFVPKFATPAPVVQPVANAQQVIYPAGMPYVSLV